MAKGKHHEAQRVILPNGMWVLLYSDGTVKLGGYDRRMQVTEVLNRDGMGHVFVTVQPSTETPRGTQSRTTDLIAVPRKAWEAVARSAPDAQ